MITNQLSRLIGSTLCIVLLSATVRADSIFVDLNLYDTGSRTTGGGLTGTGTWAGAGNFTIDWEITSAIVGSETVFTYEYTLTRTSAAQGGVSHSLFETSLDFEASDLRAGSSTPLEGPKLYEPGAGNPNLPGDLFGLKFDFGSTNLSVVYILKTVRVPVWGDFYSKDGAAGGTDNTVWNDGFGTDPTLATLDFTDWIPTPDTAVIVPLPAAVWAAMALCGVVGAARLRGRRSET